MSISSDTTVIAGQPSWHLFSDTVEAWLTETGGHLGPISFNLDGRTVSPYNVAPWVEEPESADLPPILRVLRGDFFCMPFGGNDSPYGSEQYPPHGETANGNWTLEALTEAGDGSVTLHASLAPRVRAGRVDKYVTLRQGESVVYQRHVVSGMTGKMSFGHHAMLKFPPEQGSGLISTSPFVIGRTAPEPVERPENRGYSLLQPDTAFTSLESVDTITGAQTDLSRYPLRKGFEDLVMLVADPALTMAWTAVSFPNLGFVWFALKNPSVLRQTVFWLSNAGRHYPPWSGRHDNVMGLEEVTSYFHYGLLESAAENPVARMGYPTCVDFDRQASLDVRYIMGVAPIGSDFDHVRDIVSCNGAIDIVSRTGQSVRTQVDIGYLGIDTDLKN